MLSTDFEMLSFESFKSDYLIVKIAEVNICRSDFLQMLKNDYLVIKIGVDTAENGSRKE